MRTLEFLIGISWIIFWVYWVVSAIRTTAGQLDTSRRRERGVFLLLWVILYLALSRPLHLGQMTLQGHLALKIIGTLIFYGGVALAIWARRAMGSNWGMPMTTNENSKLVTDGPYRFIRHPIYAAVTVMSLSSGIVLSRAWMLVFVVMSVYWIYCGLQEEKDLAKRFPKEYPGYKRRTKMFVPYLI